jgi:hypothetical protein
MENIKLKLKTGANTILEFNGDIVYSAPHKYIVIIDKDDNVTNIEEGTRFIIGDLFPKVYKVEGINEYPTNKNYVHDCIELNLRKDMYDNRDDFDNKIAYND